MNQYKAIRFFTAATVMFILSLLLIMIIIESFEANALIPMILILGIFLTFWFGIRKIDFRDTNNSFFNFSVGIWVPIGAVICYVLHVYTNMTIVLASAIPGVLAAFIPALNKKSEYLKKLPAAIYCGTFVGMASVEVAPSINFILIAGGISGIFYMLLKNEFVGMGGKLGTTAFVGVVICSLIYYFF